MSSFLKGFRGSLIIKRIVGICPFAMAIAEDRVRITPGCTLFACVYLLFNIAVYTGLATSQNDEFAVTSLSSTAILSSNVDAITVGVVNNLMLISAIINRRSHAKLLNSLQQLHRSAACDYSKLHLRNVCYAAVYFALLLANLLVWENKDHHSPWQSKLFSVIFSCASLNILVFMLHAQDVALVLYNAIENCFRTQNSPLDISPENMHRLYDLYIASEYFSQCFGFQILLSTLHDMLILANLMFYIVEQYAFVNCRMTFHEWFELGVNAAPVFLKSALLFAIMDRTNSLVSRLEVSRMHDNCGRTDLMAVESDWTRGVRVRVVRIVRMWTCTK